MSMNLPDGIEAINIPNPYFRGSAKEGRDDASDAANKEGGSDSITDLPF
jgi:hypothetical protein